MNVRLGDLRNIIREEYLRGVPEFAFKEATRKYVEEIRSHLKKFIVANIKNYADQRDAYGIANEVLEKLEEDINDNLSDKLYQFTRRV